jgi:hypothetical protein
LMRVSDIGDLKEVLLWFVTTLSLIHILTRIGNY